MLSQLSDPIAAAFMAYRLGHLFQAEWICQAILEQQPREIRTLHLLAVIAYQTGRLESAIAHYQQVIALAPNHCEAHSNLAIALQAAGQLDTAIVHFRQALHHNPSFASAHFNLGNLLLNQLDPDIDGAIAHYQQAIALHPAFTRAHTNLGNAWLAKGNLALAMTSFQQAVALEPHNVEARINLGNVLQEQGELAAAIAEYQLALSLDPHHPLAHFNLGNACRGLGQCQQAIQHYQQAIALEPNRAEFHNNLALCLHDQGDWPQAIQQFQQAIRLQPHNPELYTNLGVAEYALGDIEAALQHHQQAIALNPEFVQAHFNLGAARYQHNDFTGAIAAYQQALARDPDFVDAHINLAYALLSAGELRSGFTEYEWFLASQHRELFAGKPQWDGSALNGQTIVVYADQGLGDAIQFCRYLPLVAQHGGRVILQCHPNLIPLLATLSDLDQVIPNTEPLAAADLYISLYSLPQRFGTTLDTIPNQVPYLDCPRLAATAMADKSGLFSQLNLELAVDQANLLQTDPSRITPPIKVGLVWASGVPPKIDSAKMHSMAMQQQQIRLRQQIVRSYQTRTISLDLLVNLTTLSWVSLYSLQVGEHAKELVSSGLDRVIDDLSPHIRTLADTAALINQLDLVISVDTAVAHLAGALGKPVWTLLPHHCNWRWLHDRDDSPWYPTMRLFRQPQPGDWSTVIQQVVQALGQMQPSSTRP